MLKITIRVTKKSGKKVKIDIYGFDAVEINNDSKGSGVGDLWLYGDKDTSGAPHNCYIIKAEHKPAILEVKQSDLDYKHTDDVFTEYAH